MATFDLVLRISEALLTPTIGAIGAYIAWQQWKANQLKLKLDRYDRRLRIYGEIKRILSIVLRDADISTDELLKFRTSVAEADFLFGPEIPKYIDEIYKRGLNLWRCRAEYRDYRQERPAGYDSQKLSTDMHTELTWLTEQFGPAQKLFKRYLDVSE